jgi:hypothetical protein
MEMEFGKPVKLPYIRKISHNGQNTNNSRRSLEEKETKIIKQQNHTNAPSKEKQLNYS